MGSKIKKAKLPVLRDICISSSCYKIEPNFEKNVQTPIFKVKLDSTASSSSFSMELQNSFDRHKQFSTGTIFLTIVVKED